MSRGVKRFDTLFFVFLVIEGLSCVTTSFEEDDPEDLDFVMPVALSVLALTKPRGRRMPVRSEEMVMMIVERVFNELKRCN